MNVASEVLTRDITVMLLLTLSLFVLGYAKKGQSGLLTRGKGLFLLAMYLCYTLWLTSSAFMI
jgi:cation:H+ antiporter